MATNYSRGRQWEYKVRDELEKQGFTAQRMAGSHSPFDVVGYKNGHVKFVQVKPVTAKNKRLSQRLTRSRTCLVSFSVFMYKPGPVQKKRRRRKKK